MLRHIRAGRLLSGLLCLALGLCLLLSPQFTAAALSMVLGALAALCGAVQLLRYFQKDTGAASAACCLLLGLPALAVGVLTTVGVRENPAALEAALPLFFGLLLMTSGLARMQSALLLARRRGQKWWLILLLGLLSLAFGALLAASRLLNFRGVDLLFLSGLFLLAEGVLTLCCTLYTAMELHALERVDAVKAELTPADPEPPQAEAAPPETQEPPAAAEPAAAQEPADPPAAPSVSGSA